MTSDSDHRYLMHLRHNAYTDKYNKLACRYLAGSLKANDQENVVLSPFSIIVLLSIVAASTSGSTRQELVAAISGNPGENGDDAYDELMSEIRHILTVMAKTDSLKTANAVCVRHDFADTVRDDYTESLEEIFGGKVFSSTDMAGDINRWVEDNTRGMITEIADESINKMLACFMNAIAFEADWNDRYSEDDIWKEDFTSADGSASRVDMLHSEEKLYVENDEYIGFVKPYRRCEYSFMALLPRRKTQKFDLRSLKKVNFSRIFKQRTCEEVIVTMPEFKFSAGGDITALCRAMGIGQVFTSAADFSPMTGEQLLIEQIIHKAFIELDRRGTRAAASSMAMARTCIATDRKPPRIVILDRPFLFAIMNERTGIPVFVGAVNTVR